MEPLANPAERTSSRVIGNSRRPAQLFREEFLHLAGQVLSSILGGDVAFLIHQPHRGNGADAVLPGDVIIPALAVEVLRPLHVLALGEVHQGVLILIERDADGRGSAQRRTFQGK